MKNIARYILILLVAAGLSSCNVKGLTSFVNPDPSTIKFYVAFFNPDPSDYQIAVVAEGQKPVDSDFHRFDHGGGTYEAYLYERNYRIVVRRVIDHNEWVADETHAPDGTFGNAHYNNLTMDACFVLGHGWQP